MPAPSETDLARWEKWDDLRARQEAATTEEERAALKKEEDELRDAGIRELFLQEITQEPQLYWLSFVDPDKPEGSRFLGVSIVKAPGAMMATQVAWDLGCNPGGEVQCLPIPAEHVPDEKYLNRLLSKEELEEAGLA